MVDKFVTIGDFILLLLRKLSTASISVDSSPMAFPLLFITAKRSASGSVAKPKSLSESKTSLERSCKFSGKGSVPLVKLPEVSQLIETTSQPSIDKRRGSAKAAAPLTVSIATLNPRLLIFSI